MMKLTKSHIKEAIEFLRNDINVSPYAECVAINSESLTTSQQEQPNTLINFEMLVSIHDEQN